MARGPAKFTQKKDECIYCGIRDVKLTDEHIVPFSLGGTHVIKNAICSKCADITKNFEQRVARDLWGDARNAFDAPTRRPKERDRFIKITDPNTGKKLKFPKHIYPAGLVFYKMGKAGILLGLPENFDISKYWKMVVINDDKRMEEFHKKYPGKLILKFRHIPQEFGQLLAKIAYGQILTQLESDDFDPIILPYILGNKKNVSWVVGGCPNDQKPEPSNGYNISTVVFGDRDRVLLIALIRLYANTHAPAYHAIVGQVKGRYKVEAVLEKLGPGTFSFIDNDKHSEGTQMNDHWVPKIWPNIWLDRIGSR